MSFNEWYFSYDTFFKSILLSYEKERAISMLNKMKARLFVGLDRLVAMSFIVMIGGAIGST